MGIISALARLVGAVVVLLIVVGIAVAAGTEHANRDIAASPSAVTTDGQLQLISNACCKHCTKGKACGDSCIQASKTCTKPPGCACD